MAKFNQNTAPYFNDYDPSKNYGQIMFTPGRPVQARELTQLQQSMQSQVGALGDSIFKNGSVVSNCRSSIIIRDYVRLAALTPSLVAPIVDIYDQNYTVKGTVSQIEARIIKGTNIVSGATVDPATLFVSYTKTAIDGTTKVFIPGETLAIYDENNVAVYEVIVRCPGCPGSTLGSEIPANGKSTFFSLDSGIVYFNQQFININSQEIIGEKYTPFDVNGKNTSTTSYKLGLDINYGIITSVDDSSLLDPSLGYPNAGAPGADRLQTTAILSKRTYDAADGDNFITLCKVDTKGLVSYMVSSSDYSGIMDVLAQRTYDASGNFTVNPFKAKFYNAKKATANDPYGWTVGGDPSKIVAVVSPGLGYVKGYKVVTTTDTPITFDKARDTEVARQHTSYLGPRPSTIVNPVKTTLWVNTNSGTSVMGIQTVLLYDGPIASGAATGNVIGSFQVFDENRSGSNLEIFFYNLALNTNKNFSMCKSVATADGLFAASTILTGGVATINNADSPSLLYDLGVQNVKTLRDADNNLNGNSILEIRRKLTGTLDGNGAITFNAGTNESFVGYNPVLNIGWIGTYPATSQVAFTSSNLTVSDTSMIINLGSSFSGNTISLTADLIRVSQKENTKTLTTQTFTTNTTPVGSIGAAIPLGNVDGYKIVSVTLIKPGDGTFVPQNITSQYRFDGGQTDNYYSEAKLVRLSTNNSFVSGMFLTISYKYFAHTGTAGFFTVDSYSQLITDGSLGLGYQDIPTYTATNGTIFNLAQTIDFRPNFIGGVLDSNAVIPRMGSTMIYDVEYYLARTDLLQIDQTNKVYIKRGIPSLNPIVPTTDSNSMAIYQINLNPYTYSISDVNTTFIDNSVYTMKDIGSLASRIVNLEYYTTMNMLEQSASNVNITDGSGNSVYKNGFVVDNFSNFSAADLTNIEFNASMDRTIGQLRPEFYSYNIGLNPNKTTSTGVQWNDNVATLPYQSVVLAENPYATQTLSVNAYLQTSRTGSIVLSPNIDTWSDDKVLPTITANATNGTAALKAIQQPTKLFGVDWGTWVDMNQTIVQHGFAILPNFGMRLPYISQSSSSTVSKIAPVVQTVDARRDSYSDSSIVKDVQINPFIRSQLVEFYATKMKPNTVVYAYFDGINVSQYCRKITQVVTDNVLLAQNETVFGGTPLMTDANGNLNGQFNLPSGTFVTGQKVFLLSDDADLSDNTHAETTRATATYFAGGLQQAAQAATKNAITSTYNATNVNQTTGSTNVARGQAVTSTLQQPARWYDPIAQSFTVAESCFITQLDLYFQYIDRVADTILIELRTMVGGYPSDTIIAQKQFTPGQLTALGGGVSNDSSAVTPIVFDVPVYLDASTTYCFAIGGYSPNTTLWVANTGDSVVDMPGKVAEQPTQPFTAYRSVNGTAWNIEPYQTIKFKLYKAKFDISAPLSLNLYNDPKDGTTFGLDNNPFETQAGSNAVRVYAKNHGCVVNDRVHISVYDGRPITIEVGNGAPPQIGQILTTPSGSGEVVNVIPTGVAAQYYVYTKNVTGIFNNTENYSCAALSINYRNNYLLSLNGGSAIVGLIANESLGTIISDITAAYPTPTFGGVGMNYFSQTHIITAVDSIDSFIIQIAQTFTSSSRWGEDMVNASQMNRKFDVFNVSGAYIPYNTSETWNISTIGQTDYAIKPSISFVPMQDVHMSVPAKMACAINEIRVFGTTRKSVELNASFTSTDENISPVINVDTFAITCISNRFGSNTAAQWNVAPNATGRYIDELSSLGIEQYKYVTQNIVLANPASDIQIYVKAYKDITANFQVYVKPISPFETRTNVNVPWIKCDLIDTSVSSASTSDIKEYSILASTDCSAWVAGEFSAFRIKLVANGTNSGKPVLFESLRAIAIT